MKRTLLLIIILIILLLGIFLSGIFFEKYTSNPARQKLTSVMVVDRINEEAFLITRSVYLDQDIEIVVDAGSDWSNFWWGQTLQAQALVKVSLGVDLQNITPDQIIVNELEKKITIDLPEPSIISKEIIGDIEVDNQQGLLKLLFDNDTNKDYNLAYSELTTQAEKAVEQKEELFMESKTEALKILELIFNDTGYSLIVE
ncbi:MAG TPA: DUF4230 domain-containing protein [Candidatus Dojkabacteria bacterium]|nr:DUF4230 domain-containing protein [Candidatus Dojkabacteria bacterium]